MTIIFYDIPSTTSTKAWSPHTWKVRFALNFKGIPYKTEWIEYPDIEEHCKKLGIAPTQTSVNEKPPLYTLPAIYDPSTGVSMADSQPIVEYLEKTYPDTPTLFPHNTLGLITAFDEAYTETVDLRSLVVPLVAARLNPRSEEYFRRTREKAFGVSKLEDAIPTGEDAAQKWAQVEKDLGKVAMWYEKNDGKGPFLMGETVSYADLIVGAKMKWVKLILGEDHKSWKDIEGFNGGRWKMLLDAFEMYSKVD